MNINILSLLCVRSVLSHIVHYVQRQSKAIQSLCAFDWVKIRRRRRQSHCRKRLFLKLSTEYHLFRFQLDPTAWIGNIFEFCHAETNTLQMPGQLERKKKLQEIRTANERHKFIEELALMKKKNGWRCFIVFLKIPSWNWFMQAHQPESKTKCSLRKSKPEWRICIYYRISCEKWTDEEVAASLDLLQQLVVIRI